MVRDITGKTKLNKGVEIPWFGMGALRPKEEGQVKKAVAINQLK